MGMAEEGVAEVEGGLEEWDEAAEELYLLCSLPTP